MNSTQLNEVLADEISKIRSGKSKVEVANSVARLASVMVAVANVELKAMNIGKGGTKRLPRLLLERSRA